MAQVTLVVLPLGSSVKSAMLWPSNGLMKSSLIVTRDEDEDRLEYPEGTIAMAPVWQYLLQGESGSA